MSTTDVVSVLAAAFLFLITMLTGLIAWIFLDFRRQVMEQVRVNGRHLDSLMSSVWGLRWEVDDVERFLSDELHYKPIVPPVIPRPDERG